MNTILYTVLPDNIVLDNLLLTAVHFVLILIGMRLAEKVNWPIVFAMGIIWLISILFRFSQFSLSGINWLSYFIAAILILFRLAADKYNYKTIAVSDLKPGMILSVGTVLAFARSRVSGLPLYTSEDLKSRLSSQEVESIVRWSNSKNGQAILSHFSSPLFLYSPLLYL